MTARCPECYEEFEDADAVARHHAVRHGETGLGVPTGEKVRSFWDAEAPTEVGAPTGGTAGAPRSRPHLPVGVIVALAVAVAVIIGAVVVSSHGPGKTAAAPTPASTIPPVPATRPAARPVGLDSAVVTAADLGGAWSALVPAGALAADQLTQDVCGSSLWGQDTNGYRSAFQEGSGQHAHRVVISTVLEAPSTQVADQQRQFISSPSFVPCVKQLVGAAVLSAFNATEQPRINQLSADPLNLDLTVPATGYVVTVGIDLLGGKLRVVFTEDVIVVFAGRYQGTLDIGWCTCTPAGQELVVPQTSLLVQRLTALPPDIVKGVSA